MLCSVSHVWCACVRVCKSVRVHVRVCIIKYAYSLHVCMCAHVIGSSKIPCALS